MASTLTQVSNILNLLSEADSRIEYYRFDFRSGMNRNKANNFDPVNSKGVEYPSVMWDSSELSVSHTEQPQYKVGEQTVKMMLYFDDLQYYENDGTTNILNLIEAQDALLAIAKDFMANFVVVIGPAKYSIGYITNPTYVPRTNLGNQRLITWEVAFDLTHYYPCTDAAFEIDVNTLPATIQEEDIERVF